MPSRSRATYGILCILAGALLAVLYVSVPMLQTFFTRPAINDIVTDPSDPPVFVTAPLPPYPADFADKQRQGYPEIAPLILTASPATVFKKAQDVAIDMGWRIRAAEPAEGRIEAVASTPVMRFKDDLVVRLRAEGAGTRVDLRSRSRIGRHDLGANARRIRDFLDRLQR